MRRLLLPLALGLALTAAADYRQSYLDGLKALERGAFEEAIARLRGAVAERPEEAARARLVGAIPEPYLPHYYLGRAYLALGRCPEALAEWEISERQGAIAGFASLKPEVERGRRQCAPPVVEPEREEPREAPREEPRPAPEPPPESAPSPPPSPPTEPAAEATPSTPTLTPPVAVNGATVLPEVLIEAMQAHFDGEYEVALRLLDRSPTQTLECRFFVALFRAASRHALYLLGGGQEENLLADAIEDLRRARQENPAFSPHPDFFSPRFVEFFRNHPP